jgi:hypothetical protein
VGNRCDYETVDPQLTKATPPRPRPLKGLHADNRVTRFDANEVKQGAHAEVQKRGPDEPEVKPQGFFQAIGSWLAGAVKSAGSALETVVTGVVNGVVGAAKNLVEGAGNIFSGIGKLFQGDFGGALSSIGSGLFKIFVQQPIDGLIMFGGTAASAIQTLLRLEPPSRGMTPEEIEDARKVFGDSIDYSRVRIKEGAKGVLEPIVRPFVFGDTIFAQSDGAKKKLTSAELIHELVHVWQHQHGGTDYISEAIAAQVIGDGYNWRKGIDAGLSFGQLNPEQQADFIKDAYTAGFFSNPNQRFVYGGVDYTAQIRQAWADIHAGRNAP